MYNYANNFKTIYEQLSWKCSFHLFFYFVTSILVPIVIRKMTVEVEGHQNHDRGHGALGKLSFDILSTVSQLITSLGFHHLPGL